MKKTYENGSWMITLILAMLLVISGCVTGEVTLENSEGKIKIGAAMPLTSYASINGEADAKAIQLAVEKINSAGGINGRPIELILEDYQSDTEQVLSVYKKFTEVDDVDAIIGPVWTVFAEVGAPVANEAKIPTIMTDGDAKYETLAGYGDYFFTTWFPVFGGHENLIDYIRESGKNKVSIVYDDGSPYSLEMYELFKEIAINNGFTVVSEHKLHFGDRDFKTEIVKMNKFKPDFIYAPFSAPDDLGIFMKQAIELGADYPGIVGVEFSWGELLKDVYNGWGGDVVFAYPKTNSKKDEEFKRLFESEYGESVDTYPSSIKNAYDAVMMLAEAFGNNPRNGEELREELLKIKDFDGFSQESLEFDENGIVSKPEYVLKIWKDGKFVPLK